MKKATEFGKKYAEAIKSNASKSKKDRIARKQAFLDYKEARKKHDAAEPERLKKRQEELSELERTKPEREKARQERIAAREKAKQEEGQKSMEAVKPVESIPENVESAEKPVNKDG